LPPGPGKLFDLGEHPGLVLGAGDRVPGEILRSDRMHELLLRIDEIEGPDFTRRLYWVTAADGDDRALVYTSTGGRPPESLDVGEGSGRDYRWWGLTK
jgi:hypothetical protein